MSNSPDIVRPLVHRLGVVGFARVRAFQGSGAPSGLRSHRLVRRVAPVLCALAGLLVFAATPAFATAPSVEEESAADVSSTSATFDAQVNPGGAEITYTFEYAPAGGSFKPVAEAEGSGNLPEGTAAVSLSVHVQGLLPSTSYELRLVASNSVEKVTGEPVSFTTQRGGGEFVLPDGRQYEMVTPPEKEGALFYGLNHFGSTETAGPIQASAEGDAIVDLASQPTEAEPQGYSGHVSVFSARGPKGWSSRVIAPPRDVASTFTGRRSENLLFSEDLSHALVQQYGSFEPLSPEATESTPYLRTVDVNGNVNEPCDAPALSSSSCFAPLVTRANDTTSPFVPFGERCVHPVICGPVLEGGSADLSHVVVHSEFPLTSTPANGGGLYEWFDGKLQLVSVLPGADEGFGGYVWLAGGDHTAPDSDLEGAGVRHAVSENGERVIFADGVSLWMRDVATSETVLIDAEGLYMTASSDASKVFFLNGENLEVFEVASGAGEPLAGKVTDLTVDPHAGESAGVTNVLGASDDGSYVYFAAAGALAANATPASTSECNDINIDGLKSTVGCNIYAYHNGVTTLVATGWMEDTLGYWSRVSPDGRWLAFMSARGRGLTGYDTREALGGHADAEVYLYDASTGTLACASCDPTGARPVGEDDDGNEGAPGWVAANVPDLARIFEVSGNAPSRYQPRYLSDSGRLFFESLDPLVPKDVNGVEDVYEYEPEGVPAGGHACGASSASGSEVYKPGHAFEVEGRSGVEGAGCVALISSGTSSEPSSFLDASETGGDVFFLTAARLAPQDLDSARDVYDAHECTSASPCVPPPVALPPACDTESSCRAAPTPQPSFYGAPASATFAGPGTLTPVVPAPGLVKPSTKSAKCRRGFVKRKGRCVKAKPKAKKKATKASRDSHDRRSN